MQIGASIINTPLVPPEFNAQLNLFSINLKLSRGRKNLDSYAQKCSFRGYEALDSFTTNNMSGFYNFLL